MSAPSAIRVYAHTITPLCRLPLILTTIIALPLCILGGNIPGIVFICLSLPLAVIDFLIWLRRWRCHRTPIAEAPFYISKFCMLIDLIMGIGLLITWITSLIFGYYRPVGLIACFALFCAWLCHTIHFLACFYFWCWSEKKPHPCQHCGHRPGTQSQPQVGIHAPHTIYTPVGRDSDERTAYDIDAAQDAEDAMLLKVDAEA